MSRKGLVRLGILGVSLILAVSLLFIACTPAQVQTVEWRFVIEEAEGTPEWNYIQHVSDVIYERTNGEVRIVLYPEEALGYEHEQLVDVISRGLLEGALERMAKQAGTEPILEIGDLPFLQNTAEDARTVTDALHPKFNKTLEGLGVYAPVLWKSAPTGVISKVNINTLEAWKGVSLRAWSPVLVELSNLLGVRPVQMPYSEAFSGLATGIIDGVYWSPASALSEATYDAGAKYYDQWNIFTMTSGAVFGDKALNSVSSSAQKAIKEVFPELVDEVWENEYWGFEKDYEGLRANGVEVVFVDPAEIDRVRAVTSVIWDTSLEKSGADGLDALNAALKAMGRSDYR
jgi:TRAP-type C4-dicarboxylate transport system substrate-binding protein